MTVRLRMRRVAARVVRRGSRTVLWTQATANLGNFLYDWMHAYNWRRRDKDIVCLRTPATEYWAGVFGAAAEELLVSPADVRLTDRREKGLHNEYGVTFDEHDLAVFVEGFLEPSGVIDPERVPPPYRLGDDDVLVNVRRGDYTEPANWRNYGFDVHDYLRVALDRSVDVGGGRIERILVVSDDPAWCRGNLGWLEERCTAFDVVETGLPPETHLAILANAPRLVLSNSTFSYWGGYLSTWRYRRPEMVVAPWFHIRTDLDGAAWQLDPRWTIVRDIPSGWALPPQ